MKQISAGVVCAFLFSFSLQAKADLFDVNISNDAVAGQYLVDLGQGLFAGGSILHEEDAGQVASVDLMMRDDLRSGAHTFTAGVGGKIAMVMTEGKGNDGGSLALGGFVKYKLPQLSALAVRGEVFYGPSVTSNNDLESLLMYTAGLEVEVIERAILHVGYRKVRVDFGGPKFDMDEGMYVGFKLEF